MRWAGHVARMGEGRGLHRVMVGKPEGKRPLGRPRLRWEDNIKMDLQEVGGSCGDWMELAQDRDRWRALMSTVRNLRVPKMRGICWLAAEPVSFSRRTLCSKKNCLFLLLFLLRTSSSVSATTLGGFWPALWFCSTIFYLYTSLSSFSLSSSLNPFLLGPAISILVFLLVLMKVVPIQLIFWQFLLYPFWLRVLPNVIFVVL